MNTESRFPEIWRTALLLAGLVGLAFALRLYRLDEQSAWIDEFQLSGNLDAPHAGTYISLLRFRGRDGFPFYYILFYYWNSAFGHGGLPALRVLALLCNLVSIPLLFVLTKSVFGRTAAGIAALCAALSPLQIWYAQSIHVTAFWALLALASVAMLYRAACTRRLRWWCLVSLANLMLVWTQPFSVFLVGLECAYMLWQLRGNLRTAALWIGVQTASCLSIYAWLHRALREVAKPEEDFAYQLPPLKTLLADWVADDAVMTTDPFAFQGAAWMFLPDSVRRFIFQAQPWIDWVMIFFLGACIAWCLYVVIRTWLARDRSRTWPASIDQAHGAVLLLAAALAPLLIHLAVTVTWRPIVLQRFTAYSNLAVYAAIGAGLAFLGRKRLRRAAVAVLLLLYAYQLCLTLPAVTRTDYLSALRHIEAGAGPRDAVLAAGMFVTWEAFRFNAGPTTYPILPAYSLTGACDKAARLLRGASGGSGVEAVWVVIEPFVFTLPPLEQFEQRLAWTGLEWQRWDLPGMNGLSVYQITPSGREHKPSLGEPAEMTVKTDYARILADLGYGPGDGAAFDTAREALRMAWDVEFVPTTLYYSLLALHLAAEGYLDVALRAADHAVALDAQLAFAHFTRTVVLGERGETHAAKESFDRTLALDWIGFAQLYGPLFSALYWDRDLESAAVRLSELERYHVFMPLVCYERAGILPLAAQARLGSH